MKKEQISIGIIEHAFNEYYGALHRYAYTFTRENEPAKDIVQQVFTALWERRDHLVIDSSLKSYLFRAVHNSSINFRTRSRKFVPIDLIASIREEPGKNRSLEATELRSQINAAIEKLPAQCRIIFLKSREEAKTYTQVADEMGIARKTVEAQMTKALKILRAELAEFLICLLVASIIFKH